MQIGEDSIKILLQAHRALKIRTRGIIVHLTIRNHPHKIRVQHPLGLIPIPPLDPLLYRRQIDRILNNLQIILHLRRIHRLAKRPGKLLILRLPHQRQQLALQMCLLPVRILRSLGGREQVSEGPSGGGDAGYGHGSYCRFGSAVGGRVGCGCGSGVPVGAEGWVDGFVGAGDCADSCEDEFALGVDHVGYAGVVYGGVDVALHHVGSVVVFDESVVA